MDTSYADSDSSSSSSTPVSYADRQRIARHQRQMRQRRQDTDQRLSRHSHIRRLYDQRQRHRSDRVQRRRRHPDASDESGSEVDGGGGGGGDDWNYRHIGDPQKKIAPFVSSQDMQFIDEVAMPTILNRLTRAQSRSSSSLASSSSSITLDFDRGVPLTPSQTRPGGGGGGGGAYPGPGGGGDDGDDDIIVRSSDVLGTHLTEADTRRHRRFGLARDPAFAMFTEDMIHVLINHNEVQSIYLSLASKRLAGGIDQPEHLIEEIVFRGMTVVNHIGVELFIIKFGTTPVIERSDVSRSDVMDASKHDTLLSSIATMTRRDRETKVDEYSASNRLIRSDIQRDEQFVPHTSLQARIDRQLVSRPVSEILEEELDRDGDDDDDPGNGGGSGGDDDVYEPWEVDYHKGGRTDAPVSWKDTSMPSWMYRYVRRHNIKGDGDETSLELEGDSSSSSSPSTKDAIPSPDELDSYIEDRLTLYIHLKRRAEPRADHAPAYALEFCFSIYHTYA